MCTRDTVVDEVLQVSNKNHMHHGCPNVVITRYWAIVSGYLPEHLRVKLKNYSSTQATV